MNTNKHTNARRKSALTLAMFTYISASLVPAYASDTELYTQANAYTGDLAPTLMMMIDTSGSMTDCVNADGTSSCTTSNTRMPTLKRAMDKILNGSTSPAVQAIPGYVRVGLARYSSNDAAWVRYPARPLDAFVDIDPDGIIEAPVVASNGDAEQVPLVSLLNTTNNTLTIPYSGGTTSQYVGMQFTNVLVPKGATITSADLVLTASAADNSNALWQIDVQDTGNAAPFSTLADINSRTYVTGTSGAVVIKPDAWVANTQYSIPVDTLVQKSVSRSDWCGGNAVSLRIKDLSGAANYRRAYSYDGAVAAGNTDYAPKLVITYTVDTKATNSCINAPFSVDIPIANNLDDITWTEGGNSTTIVNNSSSLNFATINASSKRTQAGIRFQAVNVLQGVTVTSGTLYLTGYNAASLVPAIEVSAFANDDLPAFCSSTSSCTVPSTSSMYTSTPTFPTSYAANQTLAIDVTSISQQVFARSGWAPGADIGFMLRNNSTTPALSNTATVYARNAGVTSRYPTLSLRGYKQYTNLGQLKTVRSELSTIVQALDTNNSTPLGSAMSESMRYLTGKAPYSNAAINTSPTTLNSAGNYDTPVQSNNQCSVNYLYLLTDGQPNQSNDVGANTQGLLGSACDTAIDNLTDVKPLMQSTTDSGIKKNWRCMIDIARKMANPVSNPIGVKIKTNTVLFGPGDGTAGLGMPLVAKYGNGSYYGATDESLLVSSLVDTVSNLLNESGSISAPGVAVNQLSRLTNLDRLYYSVFDADANKAFWKGNVKRYRLVIDDTAGSSIQDFKNLNAVDPDTGFFKTSSWSYWSAASDGNRALEGGAAKLLPAPDNRSGGNGPRKMYTYIGSYPSVPASSASSLDSVGVSSSTFNTSAKSVMGISDDNIYKNLINWLLGYNIGVFDQGLVAVSTSTALRAQMGGALHSRPVLVNYGYSGTDAAAAASDPSLQDNMVYISTMEGVLHGLDANTGVEKFSFIPKEALTSLSTIANNAVQSLPQFGLDLTWTAYRKDVNGDFKITASDGDAVWLFGGMRMGGRNYYALDVTDRSAPKLKWSIIGGSGSYANLGQTWSQPVVGKIKINGVIKTVLFFGGGYDSKHETAGYSSANSSDSLGNQVYVVDADTGELYWWASNTGSPTKTVTALKFSIPTEMKLLDADLDGLTDSVYFSDLGGQVFRMDIDNANTGASSLVKRVQKFADLGQATGANVTNQRRFYEAPGVARLLDPSTKRPYVVVAMGSGYRSHPLDASTQDQFYVMRDNDALRKDLRTISETDSSLQASIGPSNLATLNLSSTAGATLTSKLGWTIVLPGAGEKVLASPLIFNNEVIFTTFIPDDASNVGTTCKLVPGSANLYRMSVVDGAVSYDTNGDGTLTASDRTLTSITEGPGGEPQIVVLDGGKNAIVVGTGVTSNKKLKAGDFQRTRWYQKDK